MQIPVKAKEGVRSSRTIVTGRHEPMWVLGTGLGSSARAVGVHNHYAIFSVSQIFMSLKYVRKGELRGAFEIALCLYFFHVYIPLFVSVVWGGTRPSHMLGKTVLLRHILGPG